MPNSQRVDASGKNEFVCATRRLKRLPMSSGTQPPVVDNDVPTTDALPDSDRDTQVFIPSITEADYRNDSELRAMYEFLSDGLLTGHDVTDRQLLLMSQDFLLDEDGLMFHHNSTPSKMKLSKVVNAAPRLCLPANYVTEVLQILHDFLGHSGRDRLFLTARERYYRKNLYQCVSEYVASCDLCLRTKTNKAKSIDPLHPIRVPNGPGLMYATDHLVLSRKTVNNETAIIVFICAFSGWCFIELVKDTSALEAARAFIRRVLPVMSLSPNTVLISDKGSAYTSKFFAHLCQALNIRHLTSAVGKGQSNGRAESLVKKCKEMIKFYAPDDRHLADCIPIIELAIRSTISSVTKF